MKIVIQCAATKNPAHASAGFRTADNRFVKFVARPDLAPFSETYAYARPDDPSDDLQTWRKRLLEYNIGNSTNPLHFLPAYQLYAHKAYKNLVDKFGIEQVFILSAGWGLIPANFLTPDYDITFSQAKNVKPYSHRNKYDDYADPCHLPDDGDDIIFLGGKDYQSLFCKLTAELKGTKTIFYNSITTPRLGAGFQLKRFTTKTKTNWQYLCAQALIDGLIKFDS